MGRAESGETHLTRVNGKWDPFPTPDRRGPNLDRDVRKVRGRPGAKILNGAGKAAWTGRGNFLYAPTVLVNIPKDSPGL